MVAPWSSPGAGCCVPPLHCVWQHQWPRFALHFQPGAVLKCSVSAEAMSEPSEIDWLDGIISSFVEGVTSYVLLQVEKPHPQCSDELIIADSLQQVLAMLSM